MTEYEELRPLLFSIAYRMVGSVSEAEDVVQEAFLRYHRAGEVDSPKAWLSAVTTPRRHVERRKPRFDASRRQREELARCFFAAAREGDTDALVEMLAADVVFYGDGGGKGAGLPRPVYGRDRVARLLQGYSRRAELARLTIRPAEVNGQPGALFLDDEGRLVNVTSLDITEGVIQTIRAVINPDKLGHLGDPADSRALLQRRGG